MQEPAILAKAIEVPLSELQAIFDELKTTYYNALNNLLMDQSILKAIKAEKSPIDKLIHFNAFILVL